MRQLTILAKNEKHLVANITQLLAEEDIDLRNIDSNVIGEEAYVKLVVSDFDLALSLLTNAGYRTVSDDSVLLRVPDEPGALAKVSQQIAELGITTRAITMVHQEDGFTIAAISTDDNDKVRELFNSILVS